MFHSIKKDRPVIPTDASWRKHILAILFGNIACTFDFVVILYLSKFISAAFFPPNASELVGQIQVLGLFSVGFISRPVGAFLIGRYGDIYGRKPALLFSLSLFTIATLIIACLPTYTSMGIIAPILFIVARLVQGMAFGAQMPLGWVFAAEHAPKHKMAIYSSLATASLAVGNLLALAVTKALNGMLSFDAMMSFGWRIPFFIGVGLSAIALILERNLSETPLFLKHISQQKQLPKYFNIMPAFRRPQAIFLTILSASIQVSLVMLTVLMPKLISLRYSIEVSTLVLGTTASLLGLVVGCVYYGWLADRVNIGKALIGGSIALIVQSLSFYYYLDNSMGTYFVPMCALLGFCSGMRALCPVIFVQLFPTAVRLTSVSVTFNCVSAIIGSTLPIALFYMTNIISSTPGLYLAFIGMTAFMLGIFVYTTPQFSKLESLEDSPSSPKSLVI